jgi:hypothetical protein
LFEYFPGWEIVPPEIFASIVYHPKMSIQWTGV